FSHRPRKRCTAVRQPTSRCGRPVCVCQIIVMGASTEKARLEAEGRGALARWFGASASEAESDTDEVIAVPRRQKIGGRGDANQRRRWALLGGRGDARHFPALQKGPVRREG